MKKSLILLLVLWLFGCTNTTNQVTFEEGRYCTNISSNQGIANSLVLEFKTPKVEITNVLSSFNFNESEYEITKNILKITGKGLPSNENDQYVLVFKIDDNSITFIEDNSEHFKAFDLKDGYVFTQDCD